MQQGYDNKCSVPRIGAGLATRGIVGGADMHPVPRKGKAEDLENDERCEHRKRFK